MCGIFGYVSSNRKQVTGNPLRSRSEASRKLKNAAQIVFEGLKTLEYRGYDSWGIAVKVDSPHFAKASRGKQSGKSELKVEKHVGAISELKHHSSLTRPELIESETLRVERRSRRITPASLLALGHTRWATHGGVTEVNAHPHLDCNGEIAVVHNGIVENFQTIKEELVKKGHKFVSQTDTEVIGHLIEENLKKSKFVDSFRFAFKRLTGLNAVLAMYADSGELIPAKTGSPLVIGVGNEENFVASDTTGIIKHTKRVVFLDDGQMVILEKDLKLIDIYDGKVIRPEIITLKWKFEDVEKGNFSHFFLKEIYEQPHVLRNIANSNGQIQKMASLVENAFGTFFVACGSASYAALAGTYLFSRLAKKHVNFAIGSEFNYLEDYIGKGSLVIPISQSGESVDVIQPVIRAKEKGAKVAAIVNVLVSTLYRLADHKLLLASGPEKAVVATKSLTAMVAVLILITYCLIKKQKEGRLLLLRAAEDVKSVLEERYASKIKKVAKKLKNKEHVFIIGRGLSYATALEATLKLKEASYIHAEGFAGGELKHGVIALIEKGTPCIVFAPNDETYDEIISNAAEIKARGGYIIGIGPKNNEIFDDFLETGDLSEATMISQIVVAQMLAYYIAIEKGINPDMPRNLAKSVTVK